VAYLKYLRRRSSGGIAPAEVQDKKEQERLAHALA
jgi:hypothetical protein